MHNTVSANSILDNSIHKLQKCFVEPDKIDKSKLKNDLSFYCAITIVNMAIKNEEIEADEVYKLITGKDKRIVCDPIQNKKEEVVCS